MTDLLHFYVYNTDKMSEISDAIQAKCLAFGDRIIKLNDYLLKELQSVSNLCNQLLRSGTSIGANNAEATNAVSKTDYRAKSFIALKEARESLYWIELLHRNNYIDDKQYQSIYADCEELVKILVTRCKRINEEIEKK